MKCSQYLSCNVDNYCRSYSPVTIGKIEKSKKCPPIACLETKLFYFGVSYTSKSIIYHHQSYMRCVAWFGNNLKNMKNAHGGWLLLVNLQASKSNTPTWVLFTFFKLYKWYQIAQRITYKRCSSVYCKLSNIKTWTKPSIGVCLKSMAKYINIFTTQRIHWLI